MKTKTIRTSLLLSGLAAAVLTQATNASAQYRATGQDGITASPKVRQMLNERAAMARAATMVQYVDVDLAHPAKDYIAASPKLQAQMAERHASAFPSNDPDLVKAPNDGIAASPKVRQARKPISEQPIEVAPVGH